jgi:hypothetical protein
MVNGESEKGGRETREEEQENRAGDRNRKGRTEHREPGIESPSPLTVHRSLLFSPTLNS